MKSYQDARRQIAKLYKSPRWLKLKAEQLRKSPHCVCRIHAGQQVRADVVDHIVKHYGDQAIFFDPTNLQSLAKGCHDSWKQRLERSGVDYIGGWDERGYPLDPKHHWNHG